MKSNESSELQSKTTDLIYFRINKTEQNKSKAVDVGYRFHFHELSVTVDEAGEGVRRKTIFSRLYGTVTCSK